MGIFGIIGLLLVLVGAFMLRKKKTKAGMVVLFIGGLFAWYTYFVKS